MLWSCMDILNLVSLYRNSVQQCYVEQWAGTNICALSLIAPGMNCMMGTNRYWCATIIIQTQINLSFIRIVYLDRIPTARNEWTAHLTSSIIAGYIILLCP